MTAMLGAIEVGGTKIICAAGNAEHIVARTRIETGTPEAVVDAIVAFFQRVGAAFSPIAALGKLCAGRDLCVRRGTFADFGVRRAF